VPHRDAVKREERPGRGAHQRGRGKGTDAKDSTGSAVRNRAGSSTPAERKSTRDETRAALLDAMDVPAPWKRLGDVLPEVTS